jgi:Zn-dependent protease
MIWVIMLLLETEQGEIRVGDLSFTSILGRAIALIIGFTIHEFAHAWVAYRLGDTTPLFQKRLTLDPRAHLDPLGTILALLFGFGWARPVPVNVNAFYPNEKRGLMIVALAGPVSNMILATLFAIVFRILAGVGIGGFLLNVVAVIIFFNLVLALFNLIPLSPLDGWKIMLGLVSYEQAASLHRHEQESTFILIFLLILGNIPFMPDLIGELLVPIVVFFFRLLTGV